MTICRKQAEEIRRCILPDFTDGTPDGAPEACEVNGAKRMLDALANAGAFDNTNVHVARSLRALAAQLEAGIAPGPNAAQVGVALRAEGVSQSTTLYVLRVLSKLGVLGYVRKETDVQDL